MLCSGVCSSAAAPFLFLLVPLAATQYHPIFDGKIRKTADGRYEAYLVPPAASNHASFLELLPNDDLALAWFSGSAEGADNCSIVEVCSGVEPAWSPGDLATPTRTPSSSWTLLDRCSTCSTPSSLQLGRGQWSAVLRLRPISGCCSHLMEESAGPPLEMSLQRTAHLTGTGSSTLSKETGYSPSITLQRKKRTSSPRS